MAKLSEAIKEKGKKGDWYSTKDVIGKTLTISEDFGEMFDIRVSETYYCMRVACDGDIKDLHLPKGALKAVAKLFQGVDNWKGGKFVINSVEGSGYKTVTNVSRIMGDYAPGEQQRIDWNKSNIDVPPEMLFQNDPPRQPQTPQGAPAIVDYMKAVVADKAAVMPQGATPQASPGNIPVDSKAAAISVVLTAMKDGVGVHESRIEDFIKDVLVANGMIESVAVIWTALKYGGRIKNEGGVWKVVT